MSFGAPEAKLFPPPADQLEASTTCPECDWTGSAFVWPVTAGIGIGPDRLEMPIGHERPWCPECGAALGSSRQRHPSAGT